MKFKLMNQSNCVLCVKFPMISVVYAALVSRCRYMYIFWQRVIKHKSLCCSQCPHRSYKVSNVFRTEERRERIFPTTHVQRLSALRVTCVTFFFFFFFFFFKQKTSQLAQSENLEIVIPRGSGKMRGIKSSGVSIE